MWRCSSSPRTPRPLLVLVCSKDLRRTIQPQLQAWPPAARLAAGIDGTVVILGHSDGQHFMPGVVAERSVIGGDLPLHLQHNRAYYESLAGTRAAKPIDLAVMCGCNELGANQEVQLRDGFGYRPLHRIFTVPGDLDRTDLVAQAIITIGSTAYDPSAPYQARFQICREGRCGQRGRSSHCAPAAA